MRLIRNTILVLCLLAGPVFAQVPAPVPALPDTERRTSYLISGTNCACALNFMLLGDGTDFQNWVEVYLNNVRVNYNDATFGWTITSPSGTIGNLALPITDALLTFNNVQTGTVQIVGARRPRRTSQFNEGIGVPTRNFNVVFSDITAQLREVWDKTNDFTGRGMFGIPGENISLMPPAATRAGGFMCWDATGLIPSVCAPISGSGGNVNGPNTSTGGDAVVWNNITGTLVKDVPFLQVYGTQLAHTFFSGPVSGGAAFPAWRLMVNADLPAALSGMTIDSAIIGSITPAAATFTTINATGNITTSGIIGAGGNLTIAAATLLFLNAPTVTATQSPGDNSTKLATTAYADAIAALKANLAAPSFTGVATVASATATPAGGSTAARLLFGTTAGFGIYYGSGAPTVSAAQGSIYIRSDGSSSSTRLYVNSTGSTTWVNFTSAS